MFLQPLICATLTEHRDAVGILVFDREVIIDLAMAVAGANLSAAQSAEGSCWMRSDHPVHDVKIVNVLFDDVVTGEPSEIIPVAQLPFHVAPALFAIDDPDLTSIPVAFSVHQVADRSIVNSLNRFTVTALVTSLGTGGDA